MAKYGMQLYEDDPIFLVLDREEEAIRVVNFIFGDLQLFAGYEGDEEKGYSVKVAKGYEERAERYVDTYWDNILMDLQYKLKQPHLQRMAA